LGRLFFFSCLRESSKLHRNFASAGVNFSDMEISPACLSVPLTCRIY